MDIWTLLVTLTVDPAFWLIKTVLWQALIILLLTIVYRAFRTTLVLLLPKDNWFRRTQVEEVRADDIVLITGATSGIGLALAKHLHQLGYSVVATYLTSQESGYEELRRLNAVAEEQGQPQKLFLIELDVRKQESIRVAYKEVEMLLAQNKQLRLFALINNAGLGSLQPFAWLQRQTIVSLVETNLLGNLLVTREFLPLLIKRQQRMRPTSGGGSGNDCETESGTDQHKQQKSHSRVLFVSSGLGLVPGPTYATYGITKAAQIYLARCLNLELKDRFGIKFVAVIPHNFIKNTNICAQNVKNNQLAWQELRPDERQLYREHFDEHTELTKSLEQATRKLVVTNSASAAKAGSKRVLVEGESGRLFGKQLHNCLVLLANSFRQIIGNLRGENVASTLENSGALQCFELALSLKQPPEIIFAGDSVFQLLIGSFLLVLPNSLSGLLSGSIAPNLYR